MVDVVAILLRYTASESRALSTEPWLVPILLERELLLDAHGVQDMAYQIEPGTTATDYQIANNRSAPNVGLAACDGAESEKGVWRKAEVARDLVRPKLHLLALDSLRLARRCRTA